MKLTSIEVKTIDRAEAARMLAAFAYERQRKVNMNYVNYYARMMVEGEWMPGTEIDIAYAPNGDGHKYGHLVNGQHRLMAVVNSGAAIEVAVKSFDCADQDEVAKLYGAIDTGRGRNVGDYLRALAIENEFGFTPSQNNKVGTAAAFIIAGFRNPARLNFTNNERVAAMRKYATAASVYLELVADMGTSAVHNKMKTSAVMSVGLATLDEATGVYGDEKVERFWLGVGKDDGLRIGDPRKTAHIYLFENTTKGHRATAPYQARYVANCFNAWVDGREIKYTRVPDAIAPILIAGTSFKG